MLQLSVLPSPYDPWDKINLSKLSEELRHKRTIKVQCSETGTRFFKIHSSYRVSHYNDRQKPLSHCTVTQNFHKQPKKPTTDDSIDQHSHLLLSPISETETAACWGEVPGVCIPSFAVWKFSRMKLQDFYMKRRNRCPILTTSQ